MAEKLWTVEVYDGGKPYGMRRYPDLTTPEVEEAVKAALADSNVGGVVAYRPTLDPEQS